MEIKKIMLGIVILIVEVIIVKLDFIFDLIMLVYDLPNFTISLILCIPLGLFICAIILGFPFSLWLIYRGIMLKK